MAISRKISGASVGVAAATPSPLPEKIAVVLQESRWLGLIAFSAFLALSLWGYQKGDPGWSHAVQGKVLQNPAGRGGAWLSDLLLYVFGVSAWWWVVLLLACVWFPTTSSSAVALKARGK